MYLHLGNDAVVLKKNVVGIFDLDTSTVSKNTRGYLTIAQREGRVVTVSSELPRSFVAAEEDGKITVYVSQLSSQTLLKRFTSN